MSDYTVDCSFVLFLVLSIFVGTSYSVMEFKLYFQGFKNVKSEFIVKDLTVVSIDGNLYELQLFQPPCQFQQLPTHLQKTSNLVGKTVAWSLLEFRFQILQGFKEVLNSLFKKSNITIYLKGKE